MDVLFDVGHPAHVHLFKHAMAHLRSAGHAVHVTSREKDVTVQLLDAYGIDHTPLSEKGTSTVALAREWLLRELKMVRVARSVDPDVVVSRLSPPAAHAATLLGCPSIVFDDSEHAHLPARLTHPFADVICTPTWFDRDLGPKQRSYAGLQELAYLHPDRFDPDPGALRANGVAVDDPYYVLRFVSWGAHHDVGREGLGEATKRELVSVLDELGDVYVSAEGPLPPAFEEYRLPVPPHLIHDLLAHADLYVGDSGTMATEAAVLGTPAVRASSFAGPDDAANFTVLEDEYQLLYSTSDPDRALEKARDLAASPTVGETWRRRRERLLDDTIDVTGFLLDLIAETVDGTPRLRVDAAGGDGTPPPGTGPPNRSGVPDGNRE